MFLSLLPPCYHYPVRHSWQHKQVINRQLWEDAGSWTGAQYAHFQLPPLPSSESCHRDSTATCPSHALCCDPFGSRLLLEKGEKYWACGGNLIYSALTRWIGQQVSDSEVTRAKHPMGCWQPETTQVTNGRDHHSAKGLPHVVWLFLWGQLISPSHNRFAQNAQGWEMGLFVSCSAGYGYFYRMMRSFLGKYFMGWVAQKAREGGDFVFKDGDSKNGTGKGPDEGQKGFHCHHSRSRDLLQQELNSTKRLKVRAHIHRCSFSAKTVHIFLYKEKISWVERAREPISLPNIKMPSTISPASVNP